MSSNSFPSLKDLFSLPLGKYETLSPLMHKMVALKLKLLIEILENSQDQEKTYLRELENLFRPDDGETKLSPLEQTSLLTFRSSSVNSIAELENGIFEAKLLYEKMSH